MKLPYLQADCDCKTVFFFFTRENSNQICVDFTMICVYSVDTARSTCSQWKGDNPYLSQLWTLASSVEFNTGNVDASIQVGFSCKGSDIKEATCSLYLFM